MWRNFVADWVERGLLARSRETVEELLAGYTFYIAEVLFVRKKYRLRVVGVWNWPCVLSSVAKLDLDARTARAMFL